MSDKPTVEDLRKAEQLLKDYKVCQEYKCGKVFKPKEEGGDTIYFGNQKWWCGEHYDAAMRELKEDMRG